jgi:hypothetical protein
MNSRFCTTWLSSSSMPANVSVVQKGHRGLAQMMVGARRNTSSAPLYRRLWKGLAVEPQAVALVYEQR